MLSLAEGDVVVRCTSDVQFVGPVELGRITIGRTDTQSQKGAGRDLGAVDDHRSSGQSVVQLQWALEPQ